MLNFQQMTTDQFLTDFWQQKPLIIRQAFSHFPHPISADELAGLALEEDIESRIVIETPNHAPYWHLKTGPFVETDFSGLPKTHWTLLVQGVDRIIPGVAALLDHFDFIPQWRIDDVMISYAVNQGSVGPHYDHYDVFLYQATGRLKWLLTTKQCHKNNHLADVDLRIMAEFDVEEEYLLEAGDMLYLPPHVGHYGISLSDDCMTYSFGYRSYQGLELWDSFGDFLSEKEITTPLYQDPNWSKIPATSALIPDAWQQARKLLQQFLNDEQLIQSWFGCFATRLDRQAEQQLSCPLEEGLHTLQDFLQELSLTDTLLRDAACRLAYIDGQELQFFINGVQWDTTNISPELIRYVSNHRTLSMTELKVYLDKDEDKLFLYELWRLQWLSIPF